MMQYIILCNDRKIPILMKKHGILFKVDVIRGMLEKVESGDRDWVNTRGMMLHLLNLYAEDIKDYQLYAILRILLSNNFVKQLSMNEVFPYLDTFSMLLKNWKKGGRKGILPT